MVESRKGFKERNHAINHTRDQYAIETTSHILKLREWEEEVSYFMLIHRGKELEMTS